MAAYSYGSSYESVMKKSCGYRQLGNYYNNLFDNVTTDQEDTNKIFVNPEFGQVGYNRLPKENADVNTGDQCNTWRLGQCCDGRSISKNAYTQCADGVCSSYRDMKLPTNQLYSRY